MSYIEMLDIKTICEQLDAGGVNREDATSAS